MAFCCCRWRPVTGSATFRAVTDAALVLNYGLDRLRFTSPVYAGSRVRYRSRVLAAEPKGPGRTLLRQEAVMEVEGQEKPAVVAELLAMFVARSLRGPAMRRPPEARRRREDSGSRRQRSPGSASSSLRGHCGGPSPPA